MAETFTNDGLDHIYNIYYRAGTPLTFFYVGLFVSQTPTTVPASTASGAAAGWEEIGASTGTYARQIVAASLISAAGNIGGSARGSAWPQVTFTGFTGLSPANGYAILSASTIGAGSPFAFANFDSAASRAFSSVSDSLALTPTAKALP
jgi:hypothetical protein